MPQFDIKVDEIKVDENGNISTAIIISSSSGGAILIFVIMVLVIWCLRKFVDRPLSESYSISSVESNEETRNNQEILINGDVSNLVENDHNIIDGDNLNAFANNNISPDLLGSTSEAPLQTAANTTLPEPLLPILTTQSVPAISNLDTQLNGSFWFNMGTRKNPMQR